MEAELLEAIREAPDDDAPRLVYADWLSQRGDARGELIAVQCQLARLRADPLVDDPVRDRLERHQIRLFAEYRERWKSPLIRYGVGDVEYSRGFVERITVEESAFGQRAKEILERAPTISHVDCWQSTPELTPPVPPELARIPSIRFATTKFACAALASPDARGLTAIAAGDADADAVAASLAKSSLDRVTSLDLSLSLSNKGFETLRKWRGFERVRRLNIEQTRVSTQLGTFATAPETPPLVSLDVSGNRLGAATIRALLRSQRLASLEELDIHDTSVSGAALAGTTLPALRKLRVSSPALDARIATSRALGSVERLELVGMYEGDGEFDLDTDAAIAIASSSVLASLRALVFGRGRFERAADVIRAIRAGFDELVLNEMGLDATAVRALAETASLATVRVLDIGRNQIGADGMGVLATTRHLRPRILRLSNTGLDDDGLERLAGSPMLSEVRSLGLSGCLISDGGLASLARSPYAGKLRYLNLQNNYLTDECARVVATSSSLPKLVELDLRDNKILAVATISTLVAAGHGVTI